MYRHEEQTLRLSIPSDYASRSPCRDWSVFSRIRQTRRLTLLCQTPSPILAFLSLSRSGRIFRHISMHIPQIMRRKISTLPLTVSCYLILFYTEFLHPVLCMMYAFMLLFSYVSRSILNIFVYFIFKMPSNPVIAWLSAFLTPKQNGEPANSPFFDWSVVSLIQQTRCLTHPCQTPVPILAFLSLSRSGRIFRRISMHTTAYYAPKNLHPPLDSVLPILSSFALYFCFLLCVWCMFFCCYFLML